MVPPGVNSCHGEGGLISPQSGLQLQRMRTYSLELCVIVLCYSCLSVPLLDGLQRGLINGLKDTYCIFVLVMVYLHD